MIGKGGVCTTGCDERELCEAVSVHCAFKFGLAGKVQKLSLKTQSVRSGAIVKGQDEGCHPAAAMLLLRMRAAQCVSHSATVYLVLPAVLLRVCHCHGFIDIHAPVGRGACRHVRIKVTVDGAWQCQ